MVLVEIWYLLVECSTTIQCRDTVLRRATILGNFSLEYIGHDSRDFIVPHCLVKSIRGGTGAAARRSSILELELDFGLRTKELESGMRGPASVSF
eukprot:COSAG02_NODE_745_length_17738_cov_18.178241_15_plen_95_part_00